MSTTILACSRAGRSAAFTRHAARTLATDAHTQSDSTSGPPDAHGKRKSSMRTEFHPRRIRDSFSLYVRPWDEIDSMATFYAMLRGIEKRFGRVREFRLGRDYDVPSSYTNYFIAELADREAYERVPEKGTSVRVEVPVAARNRPGGIGLDDLQELLQPQDWEPESTGEGVYSTPIRPVPTPAGGEVRNTRILEMIVQRSTAPQTEVRHRRRMKDNGDFGVHFCRWAGFHTPAPASEPELGALAPPVPHEMQRALSKWEAYIATRERKNRSAAARGREQASESDDVLSFGEAEGESVTVAREGREDGASGVDAAAPASQSPFDEFASSPLAAAEPTSPSEEVVSAADTDAPPSTSTFAPQQPARLSQREKILQRARQHARTPLPEAVTQEAAAQKKAEERARQTEEQQSATSLRERLVKLMGGNW